MQFVLLILFTILFKILYPQRTCIECCMDYCASCLPRDIDSDCLSSKRSKCRRCRVFSMNPLDRNALLNLRVRDLRWYLNKRHVLTNYCKVSHLLLLL